MVKWLALCLLCSVSLGWAEEKTEGRLMRFPDVYKDKLVFSYGGDLWLASTSGGVARRITSHPGLELFPKFSPDGQWIAFTGQYDGNFNVYVIPSEGGEPKQLTFLPDAASDGDFFSYFFKKYKLGPLIGMRTWGGVRGIRGYIPLMDGGYVTRPEFSLYGLQSEWLIENRGADPDIEVDNRPDLVMQGRDPQLEKAIELVMKEIQEHPKKLPLRPADLPAYPRGPGM
jgi:hypothetical protein